MDRSTANQILDNINRVMTNQQGQQVPANVEASRRDLEEAGYSTKRSAHTGYIVPVITRGLKWGEPTNN